jgi:acetylornithine deacetylase
MSTELDQAIDLLQWWVDIDSVTPGEAQFLEELERHFTELGYRCDRQDVEEERWNLLVTTGKDPRLIYSTHVDTVPPFIPARREDDRLYGRGSCDTKGGIVAMRFAAERLRAAGYEELGFLFVVGEEVDHCGAKVSQGLADRIQPERIVLCEPTLNRVVAAQKGMIKLILRAEGKAAHSAYPERGVSAVHRLLDTVSRLRAEPWPTHEVLGPTTLNVGVIEGGVAANVFAPEAHAQVLFRTVSESDALIEHILDLATEGVTIEVGPHNDPVFFDPPDEHLQCTVAFNTDATYLGPLGPIWLVGPGDIQDAHSDHEHITYEQLGNGIDLYEVLGRRVLQG